MIQFDIKRAIAEFKQLNITGQERKAGDDFFAKYGVGVDTEVADRPLERFRQYEGLLEKMNEANPAKFADIHKGTPYYFLFWNAFDCRAYDKALFYIDAAISEDIKHHGESKWKSSQAASYLWLKDADKLGGRRVIVATKDLLEKQTARFTSISSKPFTLNDFTGKFISKLMGDPSTRTIVTSFYAFLLESEERIKELELRSRHGGSIELPLTFLFKGGLIFESLLKMQYPIHKAGTLGNVFKDSDFQKDFPYGLSTSAKSLAEVVGYLNAPKSDSDQDARQIRIAFCVTAKLRNIAGHNLVWDDIFDRSEKLKGLFEQQINAIFYFVRRKYLGTAPQSALVV
jgi:hypothetical protein